MADKHPYVTTPSHIVRVIGQFRKSFPSAVTAETLRKLGFARKNESYVLNVLRFLGLIDQEGNKTELAAKVFSQHDDAAFSQEFETLVAKSYGELFSLHGDDAWGLDKDALITFFRTTDQTTDIVGKLQAATFQLLAAYSGHGEIPGAKAGTTKRATSRAKRKTKESKEIPSAEPSIPPTVQADQRKRPENVGLTVRIEINLPSDGDQDTYDRIFRSIRENLLGD